MSCDDIFEYSQSPFLCCEFLECFNKMKKKRHTIDKIRNLEKKMGYRRIATKTFYLSIA